MVDLIGAYGRQLLNGVTRYGTENGEWSFALPPTWVFAPAQQWKWSDWHVDGFILQTASEEMVKIVLERGLPAVNVSSVKQETGLPSVLTDNIAVGAMAANYLLARGFRRFGFVSLSWEAGYASQRANGFFGAVTAAGHDVTFDAGSPSLPEGARTVVPDFMTWLRDVPKPVALFATNDFRAAEVLKWCASIGVAVPEHAAVLGVDNDELVYRTVRPSLSSIDPGSERVGYAAAKYLDRLLDTGNAKDGADDFVAPLGVVTRQSTDVLAIEDAIVAAAVEFVRENAARPIGVDDILRHVDVSRRSLERRFASALGRSPLAEIRRVHLERAKQLLTATDLSVPDIATRAGFGDPWRFGSTFRKQIGMTPTSYRRQTRLG